MAVKLRLTRMGKKKKPFYRIVAVDSRVSRDGKYIEKVGHYNPVQSPPEIEISEEKALKWLGRGAQLSDTVKNILSKQGIMLKWHLQKSGASEEKIQEELKKWELLQLEKTKREEAMKIQKEREEKESKEEAEKEQVEEKVEVKEKVEVEVETKQVAEEESHADATQEAQQEVVEDIIETQPEEEKSSND